MTKILGLQPTPHLKLLRFVCQAVLTQKFASQHELQQTIQRLFNFGPAKARDYIGLALKLGLLKRDLSISQLGQQLLDIETFPADDLNLTIKEKELFLRLLLEKDETCVTSLLNIISRNPGIELTELQNTFCETVGFYHLKTGARRVKTLIRLEWLASLDLIEIRKNRYWLSKMGSRLLRLLQTKRVKDIPSILYKNYVDQIEKAEEAISSIIRYTSLGSVIIRYFISAIHNSLKDKTGRSLEHVVCEGYRVLGFYVKPLGSERTGKAVPDSLVFVYENQYPTSCIVNDAKNIEKYNPTSKDLAKMLNYCKLAHNSTNLDICGVFIAPNFSVNAHSKIQKIKKPSYIVNIALLTINGFLQLIRMILNKREEGIFIRPKLIYTLLAGAQGVIDEKYVQKEIDTFSEFILF